MKQAHFAPRGASFVSPLPTKTKKGFELDEYKTLTK